MKTNRKLQRRQRIVLLALRDFGYWRRDAMWHTDFPAHTKRICESLVSRGMAYRDYRRAMEISGAGPDYRLTALGMHAAENLK